MGLADRSCAAAGGVRSPAGVTTPVLPGGSTVARAARGWGLGLPALGGDPGWCDDPSAALAWQQAATGVGILTGVHLDVEFWAHPRWHDDPTGVASGYLRLVAALEEQTSLECDVPWWLHRYRDAADEPLDVAVDIARPMLDAGVRRDRGPRPQRMAVGAGGRHRRMSQADTATRAALPRPSTLTVARTSPSRTPSSSALAWSCGRNQLSMPQLICQLWSEQRR